VDACGVQNLFLEARLAIDAIDEMLAGNHPPQRLVDPGFVITRETREQRRAPDVGLPAAAVATRKSTGLPRRSPRQASGSGG
jgi:hypothetical protein